MLREGGVRRSTSSTVAWRKGEPTARHFGVQVKGHTAKPKRGQLKEKLETKHLRYYSSCRDPVFLFRIDPDTGAGNWVFIQRYLKQKGMAEKLGKQNTATIAFEPGHALEDQELFKKELVEAFKFMADEFPGTPTAAVTKRKEFLQSLDPNLAVDLTATEKGERMSIGPKPGSEAPGPMLTGQFSADQWQALNTGQPVTLIASELTADTPLIQQLLSELGDKEITISRGESVSRMSGTVQVSLEGVSDFSLQVSGEWTISPHKLSFDGMLPETPFHLKSVWVGFDSPDLHYPDVALSFDYSKWAGQSLLQLAYFDDLRRLFENRPIHLRFMARGRHLYTGKVEAAQLAQGGRLAGSVEWIAKLQQVARHFKVDRLFPSADKLGDLTSVEAHALVSLAVTGKHSQSIVGSTFNVTGRFPNAREPYPTGLDIYSIPNYYREMDFLGHPLKAGPFTMTWTDILLVSVRDLSDGQKIVTWMGGRTGRLVIVLNDFSPTSLG